MFLRTLFLGIAITTALFADVSQNDSQEIVESSNAFCFDLAKPMYQKEANSVYSPFSLFTCLSMVTSGAQGTTYKSMKNGLHWSGNTEEVALAMNALNKQLLTHSSEPDCILKFKNANALYSEVDTTFLPLFQKIVEDDYQANLQSIDFSMQARVIDTINTWVANSTEHKIPRLLRPGDVDGSTRLALINAIYFSGQWQRAFSKRKTSLQPFNVDQKSVQKVSMMRQVETFSYLEQSSVQILSLPFQSCGTEGFRPILLVALPATLDDFNDLQSNLSPAQVQQWLSGLKPNLIDVQLPKFCLRKRFDMEKTLRVLGMSQAFGRDADFSGIDGMKDLFLSKVIHEAYFDLNEHGVEAAAATAAAINVTSVGPSKENPISFTANRPFLFLLVDEVTGVILFIGKFTDPSLVGCG